MERRAAGGVGRLAPEGNELSCWRLYGWYEKRIGRYWPVKPEAMVLGAEKICTSCFRVWKTEATKSIWRLTSRCGW